MPKGAGPSGRKQGQLKCYVHRLIIGNLGNENGKKTNRLAQLCMCITLFFTFLSGPHCATTSWNFLISRFIEDGNTWQRFFLSICKLRYSPLEFNYWKIANIWQIWIVAIRAMKFDSARIYFFEWRFPSHCRRRCLSFLICRWVPCVVLLFFSYPWIQLIQTRGGGGRGCPPHTVKLFTGSVKTIKMKINF